MGKPWLTRAGVAVALLGLLTGGCGDDGASDGGALVEVAQPDPEPAPTPTTAEAGDQPVEDSDPVTQPTAPVASATPEVETSAEEVPQQRLLVYAVGVAEEGAPEGFFAVDRVVVHDIGAGQQVGSFEFGGGDNFPVGVGIAGELLVVATSVKVWVVDQQGTEIAVLHDDPAGSVSSLAASPDGSMAAIAWPGPLDGSGEAVVFDIASGDEVLRVSSDGPAMVDFRPLTVQWADPDGDLLAIRGFKASNAHPAVALMSLSGDVNLLPWPDVAPAPAAWGNLALAPDLRHAVRSNADCLGPENVNTVDVVDVRSETVVASIGDGPQVLRKVRWAPDSSTVLAVVHPPEECGTADADDWTAVVVDPAAGTTVEVPDPAAVEAQWDAERGYRADCPDWDGPPPECGILVDGIEIARVQRPGHQMIIGVIE